MTVAACCAVAATPTFASTIGLSTEHGANGSEFGVWVQYDAAAGEDNDVTATSASGGRVVRVDDAGATIQVAPGDPQYGSCGLLNDHQAVCTITSALSPYELGVPTRIEAPEFTLGDGSNRFHAGDGGADSFLVVWGGPGPDVVDVTGALGGSIIGGGGDDNLSLGRNVDPGQVVVSGAGSHANVRNGMPGDIVDCSGSPQVAADPGDRVESTCVTG